MTVSFGSAAAAWEEESLLHPLTTGRTRSASAAIAATVVRGWRAGAVLVRREGSRFKAVMTRSLALRGSWLYAVLGFSAVLGFRATARRRGARTVAQSLPLCNARVVADF